MSTDLINRIRSLMSYYGLTQLEMAKKIGVRQPNLSAILKGERTCGEGVLNKILLSFDINKAWLLTGEGDMLKSNQSHTSTDANEIAILKEKIRALESILSEKERTIQILLKSREL